MKSDLLSELGQRLVSESLTSRALAAETAAGPHVAILPRANVLKIGGQSIIDRGRSALFPIVDEVVKNLGRHEMILGTGAGTRALEVLDAFLPQTYDADVVIETKRLRPLIRATAGANGNRPPEPPPDNGHCHALRGDAIHHSLHRPGLASRRRAATSHRRAVCCLDGVDVWSRLH